MKRKVVCILSGMFSCFRQHVARVSYRNAVTYDYHQILGSLITLELLGEITEDQNSRISEVARDIYFSLPEY